ncbi:signal peptidase I [Curtobacterium sp. Csp1]|nr:signal peptidase I [Curtobacterium sp. csp3]QKS21902.1 signal peptidase I [Curtobacterium sp. Csp1]
MVVILLAALLASFLVKTFVIRSFSIPSGSMTNTLQVGDHVVVNELAGLHRGDVVVFRDADGWLDVPGAPERVAARTPTLLGRTLSTVGFGPDTDGHLVKRLIGLPGDHVECCDAQGRMSVNGVPLVEPYVLAPEGEPASGVPFDVTVPAGRLWVMGDNRYGSADSRSHQDLPSKGFVRESDVVGRAVVVTWPVARWSWLDDHPEVFAGVTREEQGG